MRIIPTLKRLVPQPLHPPLGRFRRFARSLFASPYSIRMHAELGAFADEDVQDLPAIMVYWAKTYLAPILAPFGFTDSIQFFRNYMARVCRDSPDLTCEFLSVGAGACASEMNIAEWLREVGISNYRFECLDINPDLLKRGKASIEKKGLGRHFRFATFDVNSWRPERQYRVIIAVQSLHHFVELELLFDKIYEALHPDGYFLTDDMIGRNGHQRWPEALKFVEELWRELPEKYRYNHQLKRVDTRFENRDCSTEGFEGIRAQDVLPLLVKRFYFDFFIGFGNIIDVFIDRGFGPNFDPHREWDRVFIDRVHALDVREIESGRVKPTHIMAAMTKKPVERTLQHKNLSPEFCIRWPDQVERRIVDLGPWFHNIELAPGVWTNPHGTGPGVDYPGWRWRLIEPLLPSVAGKSVLDVGCSSGFFSLKLKELGADYVLGIDAGEQPKAIEQARFAAETRGLDIEFKVLSVYDVGEIGREFDLVLFLGVFYHLRHPLLALEALRAVCHDTLIMQTITTKNRRSLNELDPGALKNPQLKGSVLADQRFPVMRFVEGALDNDGTCWFVPNAQAVPSLLRSSGFTPNKSVFPTESEVIVRCSVHGPER